MADYYSSMMNRTFFVSGSLLYSSPGNTSNTSNCELMTTGSFSELADNISDYNITDFVSVIETCYTHPTSSGFSQYTSSLNQLGWK
jgi:hypothetical protein